MMNISSNGSKAGNDFLSEFIRGTIEYEEKIREWIENLRKAGVKASHPNDGWVDRKRNILTLVNPDFCDRIHDRLLIHDSVAIGKPDDWFIVTITGYKCELLGTEKYTFVREDEE